MFVEALCCVVFEACAPVNAMECYYFYQCMYHILEDLRIPRPNLELPSLKIYVVLHFQNFMIMVLI